MAPRSSVTEDTIAALVRRSRELLAQALALQLEARRPLQGRRTKKALAMCAVGLLYVACKPAGAADVDIKIDFSAEYSKCIDKAAGVTVDMLDCIGAEEALWDHRLNQVYQTLMRSGRFSDHSKGELRDAQRAWIDYRDKVCQANGDLSADGGSLATVIATSCSLSVTAQRAVELEQIIPH
jgi:uncharacterized protein YecT (DUF1311 family)